jgi:tRNA(adenine34) deaminase
MLKIVSRLRRRLRSEFFSISGTYRSIDYILGEGLPIGLAATGERRFFMDERRSSEDEVYMRMALDLARAAGTAAEVPVGAVVVLDGRVIGRGKNSPISMTDPTAHAEVLALREAAVAVNNYRLTGAALYVTLEPCVMCAGALVAARISRVVFGARDLRFGGVRSKFRLADAEVLNHRAEVVEGVSGAECTELIQAFFSSRR